jgi:hypothetical protein
VKTQRRQQADDAFRNPLRGLDQAVILAYFSANQPIQPPPAPLDDTSLKEPAERHRVYATLGEFARAHYPNCLHQLHCSLRSRFYFALLFS